MSESTSSLPATPLAGELEGWLAQWGAAAGTEDEAALIDQISLLEKLKAAASATQARLTVAFKASRIAERRASGVLARDLTKGIGAEVALARRESPSRAGRLVGVAEALVLEMPHTLAALTAGELSEWRATILVQETACLTREHRAEVDRLLAGRTQSMSDRALRAEAKRIAYRLDPASVVARARKAEADRRVTSSPVPDTMMNVKALLPVVQGAAVMAALTKAADARRAAGDQRTRGQLMADTFVERLTGQSEASQVPIEVQIVMSDQSFFGDDHSPAWVRGCGPVPAAFARNLLRGMEEQTRTWVRRFFTDPTSGLLTGVDAKRRLISGALRDAIIVRDQYCRVPWCGAAIRHGDHVIPVEHGGETTEANAQGLCEACNYAKQAPGWQARPGPEGAGRSVEITTPTGHAYESRPPPLPGAECDDPSSGCDADVSPPRPPAIEVYLRNPLHVEYAA